MRPFVAVNGKSLALNIQCRQLMMVFCKYSRSSSIFTKQNDSTANFAHVPWSCVVFYIARTIRVGATSLIEQIDYRTAYLLALSIYPTVVQILWERPTHSLVLVHHQQGAFRLSSAAHLMGPFTIKPFALGKTLSLFCFPPSLHLCYCTCWPPRQWGR